MIRVSKDKVIYAMAPGHDPVARVPAGTPVVIETCDCFTDQIRSEDTPFSQLDWDRINPATGPLYIEGAEVGDMLAVHIERIALADQGIMVTGPGLGVLGDRFDENVIRILPVRDGRVQFNERLSLPVHPMIGVIGTAPKDGAVSCGTPGDHGGNMDCRRITEGTTLYLPVNVPGALFSLGDLHAAMGDGEVAVCGVEIAGEVTVQFEVLKNRRWPLPMAVTADDVITIASEKSLDDAADRCVRNMVEFLETEVGMERHEAVRLCSIAGHLRVCQVVDPLKTARFELPRAILKQFGYKLPVGC